VRDCTAIEGFEATLIDNILGSLSELMSDYDGAIHSYEQALRHNQYSIPAMTSISSIFRTKEQFPRAVEYLQIILKLEPGNGEVWGSLGVFPVTQRGSNMLTSERSLLSDDGGLTTSLLRIPTSTVPSQKSTSTLLMCSIWLR